MQVVVFALGIGSTIQHAEKLVAAFQCLCAQQPVDTHNETTSESHSTSPSANNSHWPQNCVQPSAESVSSRQQMTLRQAFFAKTLRSVLTVASTGPCIPLLQHVCILRNIRSQIELHPIYFSAASSHCQPSMAYPLA